MSVAAGALDQRQVLGVRVALRPARRRSSRRPAAASRPMRPATRAVVGRHRQVERQHAVAEDALADRHDLVEVGALLVELGDHDRARHADGRALLPQQLGRAVDAVDGGDDEQRGVGGAQPGAQVADEVGVPGGVEQVDLDAVDLERARAREAARSAAGAARPRRSRETVRAVLDAARARDRARRRRAAARRGSSCRSRRGRPGRRCGCCRAGRPPVLCPAAPAGVLVGHRRSPPRRCGGSAALGAALTHTFLLRTPARQPIRGRRAPLLSSPSC